MYMFDYIYVCISACLSVLYVYVRMSVFVCKHVLLFLVHAHACVWDFICFKGISTVTGLIKY